MCLERRMKLEDKLMKMSKEGNGNYGGSLKVYGECLNPMLPYKSLLLSIEDTADFVVKEMLDKYGMDKTKSDEYCLLMRISGEKPVRLRRSESPLRILFGMDQAHLSAIRFEIARRPVKSKSRNSSHQHHQNQHHHQHHQHHPHCQSYHKHNNIVQTSPSLNNLVVNDLSDNQIKTLPTYEETLTIVRPLFNEQTNQSNNDTDPHFQFHEPELVTPANAYTKGHIHPAQLSPMDQYLTRHLPVQMTYFKSKEDAILDAIIIDIRPSVPPTSEFRLASAYVLHLMTVDILRISNKYSDSNNNNSSNSSSISSIMEHMDSFLSRVSTLLKRTIIKYRTIVAMQVYWLANCTEFLHLLINNALLQNNIRSWYYEIFAEIAQMCFENIYRSFSADLLDCVPVLFTGSIDFEKDDDKPLPQKPCPANSMSDLVRTLSSCLAILKQHNLNTALSIQLVARLLHLLDAHVVRYCLTTTCQSRQISPWQLLERIRRIRGWCDRHDFVTAADRYLQPATDGCTLLQLLDQNCSRTDDASNELETLYNLCIDLHNLNSLQVRRILETCHRPTIPQIWIDFVVSGVNQVADRMLIEDDCPIVLEPSYDLDLPLLLPEDGYYVEQLHNGAPRGLIKILTSNLLPNEWCYCQSIDIDDSDDESNPMGRINKSHYYDWLCVSSSSAMDGDPESQNDTSVDNNKSNAKTRHQLKLSDFKVTHAVQDKKPNFPDKSDNSSCDYVSNRSTMESGIETDRHTIGALDNDDMFLHQRYEEGNSSDCGWSEATMAGVLYLSDDIDSSGLEETNGYRLCTIRSLREDVERGINSVKQVVSEQYSIVEQKIGNEYQNKMVQRLDEWKEERQAEFDAIKCQEERSAESRSLAFQRYKMQKDTERLVQRERMDKIVCMDSANDHSYKFIQHSNSFSTSSTNQNHNESKITQQRGRPQHSIHSSWNQRSQSQGSTPIRSTPRSLSSDRYCWLMTQDLEKLNFQEKLDIFEFGIQRPMNIQ